VIERIPEPQLMDTEEQVWAYAQADFEVPHQEFADSLVHWLGAAAPGRAIDLGCGPGDITRRVARSLIDWTIHGIDGGRNMLDRARKETRGTGLEDRVRFSHHLLPDAALPAGEYDLVFSNSLLHHLDDPCVLWETMQQVGVPGCAVYIMDLRRPVTREGAQALVRAYGGQEPEVLQVDFYNSLLAAYTGEEVLLQLEGAGLGCLQVITISDRHLVVRGRLP
jgi:ubiquinone/menaquinone biosynthesis C-methylase UbiE